jgi:hypothetical protein
VTAGLSFRGGKFPVSWALTRSPIFSSSFPCRLSAGGAHCRAGGVLTRFALYRYTSARLLARLGRATKKKAQDRSRRFVSYQLINSKESVMWLVLRYLTAVFDQERGLSDMACFRVPMGGWTVVSQHTRTYEFAAAAACCPLSTRPRPGRRRLEVKD